MAQHRRILGICAACVLSTLLPSLSRAGTWVAFQNSYTRGTGSPITVTSTFTLLNPNTQYTLKAYNGGLQNDTTELVSNSVVYLNGAQVVGPANFNQSVAEVNVTIFPALANTLSVQVRGKPGGVLTIQVVGVDNDPPTIIASVSPAPNAAGWNNSPATVTFTCSDKTSGVASCPSPVSVSTEGANQVVSGTATDLAGNTAGTSVTINLDMTPPTITASINPTPDAGGYNSGPVTVTFNCLDALSGVASCSPTVSVSGEGSFPETGTAVDVAGNTASTTITVNISLSYFKIRSWQSGPGGNLKSPSGKCLDFGTSPLGNGATVFLNECAVANPIRVVEIAPRDQKDSQGNTIPLCSSQDNPPPSPPTPHTLCHEVMLFAGNGVIGVNNPIAINPGSTPSPPQPVTEYQLAVEPPWYSMRGGGLFSPAQQIWRLDGDSIILEGTSVDPVNPLITQPGPCINTVASTTLCPALAPPPQLVIQVQNAHGANGSPLVASIRNLADNEFWDFVPETDSRPYPTTGFVPVATSVDLWNKTCAAPQVFNDPPMVTTANGPMPLLSYLQSVGFTGCVTLANGWGWGSVLVVTGDDRVDLSYYPPFPIFAGVTIRDSRRGTTFGPQLFASYTGSNSAFDCDAVCILTVQGDYARVTGLRLRGQSRSTSTDSFKTLGGPNNAISIHSAGIFPSPPTALMLATVTELIATVDHNEMSDWITGAIRATSPFFNRADFSIACSYSGFTDAPSGGNALIYPCGVTFPLAPNVPFPPYLGFSPIPVAEDPINPPGPGTLANIRVARNFLHHNSSSETGYGIEMGNDGGRFLAEGNTFSWNRHDITGSGEPHAEYRASNNLVLSGAPNYGLILGRLQDFDMHGTDGANDLPFPLGGTYIGGAGGYYVEIDGNTFLGGDGHDYVLRGFPVALSYYHDNVSRRKESDAIHFYICLTCVYDYTAQGSTSGGESLFPITILNSQFGQSTPDPTATLGVGDFDGDGDDDLFLATGAGWYYSPGGKTEWRYLNSAHDTIDQLLFGDFANDGRTDVVGQRGSNLFVSWGGISSFEPLNSTVPPNCTMANMTVGDFNGVGRKTDIFCADGVNWWISFGGSNGFTQTGVSSNIPFQDLRFGHFAACGSGSETDVFSVQSTGWFVSCGATTAWKPQPPSLTTNPASADGLVVADFNGDGIADVGMPCSSGGVAGILASPGWQISYGGAQGWSSCNAFASPVNGANCTLISSGLPPLSPCITLANGAVGRFSGGPGADILLWNYYNYQGAATLLDFPGGAGTPYQLSASDVDAH